MVVMRACEITECVCMSYAWGGDFAYVTDGDDSAKMGSWQGGVIGG